MSDIELVIKINEKQYEHIKNMGALWIKDKGLSIISKALLNGTPLPKGHGRLGDLSKIYDRLNDAQIEGTVEYKGLGEAKQIICDAPTIIEASESEE